jgi:small subunit ribosomal protein S6
MNAYEILLMLDPELPEERQDEILARARELIESRGGTVEKHEPWGRRKLAYEIDHKGEGTYHLLLFSSDADTLDELSRILKITDGVMRHMAVRRPEGKTTADTTPSPEPAEPEPETPETETQPESEQAA